MSVTIGDSVRWKSLGGQRLNGARHLVAIDAHAEERARGDDLDRWQGYLRRRLSGAGSPSVRLRWLAIAQRWRRCTVSGTLADIYRDREAPRSHVLQLKGVSLHDWALYAAAPRGR